MRNFKDESFIGQYLSPKVIRDLRLFAIMDDEHQEHLRVSAIHDTQGYREVREALLEAVRPGLARARHPGLERQPARRPLADAAPHAQQQPAAPRRRQRGAQARRRLWGFGVNLESVDQWGDVSSHWSIAAPEERLTEAAPAAPPPFRTGLLPPQPLPPRGRGRPRGVARFALALG
jgi:stage V sporulation protein R